MRTIKFLGFAVAMAAAAVPALAQGGLQPGAFPGVDRLARIEARRLEHRQQMRQFRGQRMGRMGMAGRFGPARGFARGSQHGPGWGQAGFAGGQRMALRGPGFGQRMGAGRFANAPRAGLRAGVRAGARAGFQAGARAGFRAGMRAEATPEQQAFFKDRAAQREAVHAEVLAGKLTREQARAQMQKWAAEHRPKK